MKANPSHNSGEYKDVVDDNITIHALLCSEMKLNIFIKSKLIEVQRIHPFEIKLSLLVSLRHQVVKIAKTGVSDFY